MYRDGSRLTLGFRRGAASRLPRLGLLLLASRPSWRPADRFGRTWYGVWPSMASDTVRPPLVGKSRGRPPDRSASPRQSRTRWSGLLVEQRTVEALDEAVGLVCIPATSIGWSGWRLSRLPRGWCCGPIGNRTWGDGAGVRWGKVSSSGVRPSSAAARDPWQGLQLEA